MSLINQVVGKWNIINKPYRLSGLSVLVVLVFLEVAPSNAFIWDECGGGHTASGCLSRLYF